ncbi:hypothetical protein AV530_009595 [Patagioenas fasciata monilis]|uniref:Uncharacterized protein n=1 Tax=Patagioenas fasciata monilis TaxID=372326 RepID=A0A1V4KNA7_PATFA|nr:hypothetical protein AV530_009595 [Patagioenas fasciata monilis]
MAGSQGMMAGGHSGNGGKLRDDGAGRRCSEKRTPSLCLNLCPPVPSAGSELLARPRPLQTLKNYFCSRSPFHEGLGNIVKSKEKKPGFAPVTLRSISWSSPPWTPHPAPPLL